jgi:hypothetical protein
MKRENIYIMLGLFIVLIASLILYFFINRASQSPKNYEGTRITNFAPNNQPNTEVKTLFKDAPQNAVNTKNYNNFHIINNNIDGEKIENKTGTVKYAQGYNFIIDESENKTLVQKAGDTLKPANTSPEAFKNSPSLDVPFLSSRGYNPSRASDASKNPNVCIAIVNEVVKNREAIRAMPVREQEIYILGVLRHIPNFGGGSAKEQEELVSLIMLDIKEGRTMSAKVYCDFIRGFEPSITYKQCLLTMDKILSLDVRDRNQIKKMLEDGIYGFSTLKSEDVEFILDEIISGLERGDFSKEKMCSFVSSLISIGYNDARCIMLMEQIQNTKGIKEDDIIKILTRLQGFAVIPLVEQKKLAKEILTEIKKGTFNPASMCLKVQDLINKYIESNVVYRQCLAIMGTIASGYKNFKDDALLYKFIEDALNGISGFRFIPNLEKDKIIDAVITAIKTDEITSPIKQQEICNYIARVIMDAISNNPTYLKCTAIVKNIVKDKIINEDIILSKLTEIGGFNLLKEDVRNQKVKEVLRIVQISPSLQTEELEREISNFCIVLMGDIDNTFEQTESYKKCIGAIDEILEKRYTTRKQIQDVVAKFIIPSTAREKLVDRIVESILKDASFTDLKVIKPQICLAFAKEEYEQIKDGASYLRCIALVKDASTNKGKYTLIDLQKRLKAIFITASAVAIEGRALEILQMREYDPVLASGICSNLARGDDETSGDLTGCIKDLYILLKGGEVNKVEKFKTITNARFKSLSNDIKKQKEVDFINLIDVDDKKIDLISELNKICTVPVIINPTTPIDEEGSLTPAPIVTPEEPKYPEDGNIEDPPQSPQEGICIMLTNSVSSAIKRVNFVSKKYNNSTINRSEFVSSISDALIKDYLIPEKYTSKANEKDININDIANNLGRDYLMPARHTKYPEEALITGMNLTLSDINTNGGSNQTWKEYKNKYINHPNAFPSLYVDNAKIIDTFTRTFTTQKNNEYVRAAPFYTDFTKILSRVCTAINPDDTFNKIIINDASRLINFTLSKQNLEDKKIEIDSLISQLVNAKSRGFCDARKQNEISDAGLEWIYKNTVLIAFENSDELKLLNLSLSPEVVDAFMSRVFLDRDFILQRAEIDENLILSYIKELGNCTRTDRDINYWNRVSKEMQNKIEGKRNFAFNFDKNSQNFAEMVKQSGEYLEVRDKFANISSLSAGAVVQKLIDINGFTRLQKEDKERMEAKFLAINRGECSNTCRDGAYYELTTMLIDVRSNPDVQDLSRYLQENGECRKNITDITKAEFFAISETNKTFLARDALSLLRSFEKSAEAIRKNIINEIWDNTEQLISNSGVNNSGDVIPVAMCKKIIDDNWNQFEDINDYESEKELQDAINALENILSNEKFNDMADPPSSKCKCFIYKMLKKLESKTIDSFDVCRTTNPKNEDRPYFIFLKLQTDFYLNAYKGGSGTFSSQDKKSVCVLLFESIQKILEDTAEAKKFRLDANRNDVTLKQICVQQLRDIYSSLKVTEENFFVAKDYTSINENTSCELIPE